MAEPGESGRRPGPLAVTIGEPAGIGPDIIVKAWQDRKRLKLPPFVVIGDAALLTRRAIAMSLPLSTAAVEPGETLSPLASALPVIALSGQMRGEPASPLKDDAPLVIEAIRLGVEMVHEGKAAGIVTAPISKEALYAAGFDHPGHTEFLAVLAQEQWGAKATPVMMIASDLLRTVPVTIHVPLAQVPALLTTEKIVETGRVVATDLRTRFGITKPRLAVSGLNPHAGENGTLGKEDGGIITPAVRQLAAEGNDVRGPLPADTMFHEAARQTYDAAICMYHDQALVPAKALAFDSGVNVTLGLPFIRTSPDHGTAFDIAGTGRADVSSFVAALRMAAAMAARETRS